MRTMMINSLDLAFYAFLIIGSIYNTQVVSKELAERNSWMFLILALSTLVVRFLNGV